MKKIEKKIFPAAVATANIAFARWYMVSTLCTTVGAVKSTTHQVTTVCSRGEFYEIKKNSVKLICQDGGFNSSP